MIGSNFDKKERRDSVESLSETTHFHIFSWVVAVVLFLIASRMKVGSRNRLILHMSARLFYVLIVISGMGLVMYHETGGTLVMVKALIGIVTIAFMEMVLVRSSKGRDVKNLWIAFAVFIFATVGLGFYL